ncbi:MAG: hypothetical protein H7249_14245 [Chitinophagaceae bacterium]|nr:hypothetical protein [Oligoflexus sp.]
MKRPVQLLAWSLTASMLFHLTSCGSSSKKADDAPVLPPIQGSLNTTANSQRVPLNILAAVVYKESGLSASASKNLYGANLTSIGPTLAETAVGLSRATLGLDGSAESSTLPVQITAYGKWVRTQLDASHIDLPVSIDKPDDEYDWAWQIARMHYPDTTSPKNLQILFAMELIKVINTGFIWQDPNSDERLELKPRSTTLGISSFSPTVQANLQLDTRTSELFFVDYLQLSYYNDIGAQNRPTHIKVVHCPFTLSNCLASQLDPNNPAPIQAHYVIPPDNSILPNPVKILQHTTPTKHLNNQGVIETTTDAIVIMLVGNSGRYIDSERTQINPNWYTKAQLKNLGKIVQGVCQILPKDNPTVTAETCSALGTGVVFANAALHPHFQYGDIPDYDESIFGSLVKNPDNLSGEVAAALPSPTHLYTAGTNIPVQFSFIKGTAKLEVQRLERCNSGKTIWTTLQTLFLRSVDNKTVDLNFFDEGPNHNGQQFIRAMAYDGTGSFMGWATTDLFLNNYDKSGTPGPTDSRCSE